jgi:hypothetical protein
VRIVQSTGPNAGVILWPNAPGAVRMKADGMRSMRLGELQRRSGGAGQALTARGLPSIERRTA